MPNASYVFSNLSETYECPWTSPMSFTLYDGCPAYIDDQKVPESFLKLCEGRTYVAAHRGFLFPLNGDEFGTLKNLTKCLFGKIIRGHAFEFNKRAAASAFADYESAYEEYLSKLMNAKIDTKV